MIVRLILAGVVVLPTVAVADEFAKRRATCDPVVTSLYDDCTVQNMYRCADGSTYVESLDDIGGVFASLYDRDFQTIYQVDAFDGTGIERVVTVLDRFSLDGLLNGDREVSHNIVLNTMFPGTRMETALRGVTQMTQTQREFSAGTFLVATTEQSLELGFAGNTAFVEAEFLIDPVRRLMIEGTGTTSFAGAVMDMPALTDIVGADHPYFMTQFPEETCLEQLSMMAPVPAPQVETTHDRI